MSTATKVFLVLGLLLVLSVGVVLTFMFLDSETESLESQVVNPTFPGGSGQVRTQPASAQVIREVEQEYFSEIPEAQNLTLSKVTVSGDYAMAVYSDENVGGMVLFRKQAVGWEIVATDGGVFDIEQLKLLGVPADVASVLVNAIAAN
jgi:hypothetical protein